MAATFMPASRRTRATALEVWLFPTPVREAQTATTGSLDSIMVRVALGISKPAPRAVTLLDMCMT